MLSPDSREVAVELLRPPAGYALDLAVLTTYSLDLEALLALPLAVLAQTDAGVDDLLADPLLIMEALREAGQRVHVFVDAGAIAIPRSARALYGMLEESVHPVHAPRGGSFHPKVWVARFVGDIGPPLVRVAVLSRNVTFDCSWDVALASEGSPTSQRPVEESAPLAQLLRAVCDLADPKLPVPAHIAAAVHALADDVSRASFPSPGGFEGPVVFHALGLKGQPRTPWQPFRDGLDLLAIAPFANQTALDVLARHSTRTRTLVSRQETLDVLSEDALAAWKEVYVLADAATDESVDGEQTRPSGLHAKVIGFEKGWDVTWFVGSANLTAAAFTGRNVELMASVKGKKGRPGGYSGRGLQRFRESGFLDRFCEPYRRRARALDAALVAARKALEEARNSLVHAVLRVRCSESDGGWTWTLEGDFEVPAGIEVDVWPISVSAAHARPLTLPLPWGLPMMRLTSFVAFRLRATGSNADDVRMVLQLPAEGMPEGRTAQALRALIDSPERLLRFLRALLGGLEGLADGLTEGGERLEGSGTSWELGLGGETLLEDLVRVAARDPARLEPVRRLMETLRASEEGNQIVPEALHAVWRVVDEAIARAPDP